MKIGFDFLGLAHAKYPVKELIEALPNNIPIGYLDYSFGKDTKNLEALLASGKVIAVRVHLINAVCCRNKNCCSPDWIGDKDKLNKAINAGNLDERITLQMFTFSKLVADYPKVKWFFSPLLEHDQSEEAWKRIASMILFALPKAQLVNCPHSGWKGTYRGSILETHDASSRGDCSSLDGHKDNTGIFGMSSSERSSWRTKTKKHKYVLSWIGEANLRGPGKRVCPLKRKNLLTKEVIGKWVKRTYA